MDRTITLLDFCQNIQAALARVKAGERLTLLWDGQAVARLSPTVERAEPNSDDPIYRLDELATPMGSSDNDEIDKIIYGI